MKCDFIHAASDGHLFCCENEGESVTVSIQGRKIPRVLCDACADLLDYGGAEVEKARAQ